MFDTDVDIHLYTYTILCVCNNAVVGCALMRRISQGLTLEKLCTHPTMRGQGIATSIISCAQGIGLNLTLHVDNKQGHDMLVKYYTQRGFVVRHTNLTETCMTWGND